MFAYERLLNGTSKFSTLEKGSVASGNFLEGMTSFIQGVRRRNPAGQVARTARGGTTNVGTGLVGPRPVEINDYAAALHGLSPRQRRIAQNWPEMSPAEEAYEREMRQKLRERLQQQFPEMHRYNPGPGEKMSSVSAFLHGANFLQKMSTDPGRFSNFNLQPRGYRQPLTDQQYYQQQRSQFSPQRSPRATQPMVFSEEEAGVISRRPSFADANLQPREYRAQPQRGTVQVRAPRPRTPQLTTKSSMFIYERLLTKTSEAAVPERGLRVGLLKNDLTQLLPDDEAELVRQNVGVFQRSGPGLLPLALLGAMGGAGAERSGRELHSLLKDMKGTLVQTKMTPKGALIGAALLPGLTALLTRTGAYDRQAVNAANAVLAKARAMED